MPFRCKTCRSNQLERRSVLVRHEGQQVEIHCGACGELQNAGLTTNPITYDDLLVELAHSNGEPSHHELGFVVSRPATQVLAALMDLRSSGLVRCLELDLEDCESGEADGRWAVIRRREYLPPYDLSQDIAMSSSLDSRMRHEWGRSDLLGSWSPSLSSLVT